MRFHNILHIRSLKCKPKIRIQNSLTKELELGKVKIINIQIANTRLERFPRRYERVLKTIEDRRKTGLNYFCLPILPELLVLDLEDLKMDIFAQT